MKWEVVKVHVSECSRSGRSIPYASIGFGRIALNTAACALIDSCDQYRYVELLRGRQRNKLCVGIRFLREDEKTPNSLPLSARKRDGMPVSSFNINGKQVVESLFGPAASASKTTKYNVAKDTDAENVLIIFAE